MNVLGGECGRALCPSSSYHLWKQPKEMGKLEPFGQIQTFKFPKVQFFFSNVISLNHIKLMKFQLICQPGSQSGLFGINCIFLYLYHYRLNATQLASPFFRPFPFPYHLVHIHSSSFFHHPAHQH